MFTFDAYFRQIFIGLLLFFKNMRVCIKQVSFPQKRKTVISFHLFHFSKKYFFFRKSKTLDFPRGIPAAAAAVAWADSPPPAPPCWISRSSRWAPWSGGRGRAPPSSQGCPARPSPPGRRSSSRCTPRGDYEGKGQRGCNSPKEEIPRRWPVVRERSPISFGKMFSLISRQYLIFTKNDLLTAILSNLTYITAKSRNFLNSVSLILLCGKF